MELKAQIFDVDATTFEETVLKGSSERVMVVDFWAPWCDPCKTLGPLLEEVITGLGPGIALAKVNVDENRELATAFRVQGIPAVKIVVDGQLVDEFTGALPREQIDAKLRPHVADAPLSEQEVHEDILGQARALLESGDLIAAEALYRQAAEQDAEDGLALVGLARICLLQGRDAEVREIVGRIEQGATAYDQGQALLTHLEFQSTCAAAGGRQACAEKLVATPEDLGARFTFACCAAVEGDYETALKEWFAVVESNASFRDSSAVNAMVSVFHLLGRHHPVVGTYPQQLYRLLH